VSFNRFGLSPEVVRGAQAMGFVEPTPIQLRGFPIVLAGKDLIGTAQTGTGKTAALALPILTLLAKDGVRRSKDSRTGLPAVLGVPFSRSHEASRQMPR
jgi:ATP-dependent RNA helicase RhlE